MMDRVSLRWALYFGLALLPALLSLLLGLILGRFPDQNRLYTLSISLNVFVVMVGCLLSCLGLVACVVGLRLVGQHAHTLEQTKAEAEADRRRFLQRLDHELKNPLTAIRLGLGNLATAEPEERQTALNTIDAQATRLVRLTADIRKLAEMDTRPLERGDVNLAALIEEAVDLIREHPEGSKRQVSLSIPQAPWPLPIISADWDLIFLAVYNLMDNAVKFSEPGDRIEIRAREEAPGVVIEIADTGPGIDEADQAFVWDELYRGRRTRSVSGSGLGLPLVRAIVERHGGQVDLISRPGQGSVFSMVLPKSLGVTKL